MEEPSADVLFEQCNNSDFREMPLCRSLRNSSDEEAADRLSETMTQIVSIIVPILFGIIIIIGLIGNALVVVVVSANAQMRSTTNLLIINLAVADLLFIIFCVPFTASDYVLTYWPFGDVWCKIVQYLIVVTAYASVYTLVLMSLDRFLAVVHPIKSMSVRTERHAVIAICVLWVLIVFSSVPVYYSHGERHYPFLDEVHIVCVFLNEEYQWAAFQISFFVTSYVLPLALICGLYLCILLRLWRGVAPGGRVSAESRRGKKRVTRMVVVVVATFAICWCPIQIILVMKSLEMYEISAFGIMVQIISHVLAYMNSCVNPILYAYLSENFRKAFRKVIYCCPGGTAIGGRSPGGAISAVNNEGEGRNGRDPEDTRALNATKTTRTNGNNDIL
ncbi:allatostatin-A receptor-like [Neocloeon triangulifer]|uniref:allatostatin-A receptor-like n=1 Tax=Neocloeon triangulifer TaxID=2078957 RepID=UPI00286F8C0D|nr:allatostatin-A receptor-like [Neocloeon triangulifer]